MNDNQFALFSESHDLLDITVANYEGSVKISWKDLFAGFHNLYAVTYSSSVDFVSKIFGQLDG